MKKYLKLLNCAAFILTTTAIHSTHAHPNGPTLFNFTLTVKDVSNPQVLVGNNKKPLQPSGKNTFNINVRQSDYVFLVKYQHKGESKEAICPISGAPTMVTATINPLKDGREACTTQESGRV